MGIDVVFECTGVFAKRDDLIKHIEAGARFVILSAPAKSDDVPTVVHAVNRSGQTPAQIISCASCTTNCITPVVEVMGRRIGIREGDNDDDSRLYLRPVDCRLRQEGLPQRTGRCRQPGSGDHGSGHCDHACTTRIRRQIRRRSGSGAPCPSDP